MAVTTRLPLDWLERRRARLFLVAGVILVVYAGMNGLWAFTDLVPREHGLEIGYVVGFLGLLGLYPGLVGRQPWLSRVGAGAAVVGLGSLTIIAVADLTQLLGFGTGGLPIWEGVHLFPLVGFLVGFPAFGVACLRSDRHPTAVGLAVLTPGAIVVVMLVAIVTGNSSGLQVFVISAGEAMAHLAIGATLQSDGEHDAIPEDPPATAGDPDPELPSHD